MKSLTRLPPANGIAAMQAINVDVLNGWFFAAFFGTALCCLVLAVSSFFRWDRPDAIYLLAGSLLYLVGTILVTIIFNVPLNDALAAVDPETAHASDLDAVIALYDAEARFVTRSGETLVGRDAIREVLAGMIAAKTQFRSHVVRAVTVGDIAQLYTDFEGTMVDSSGNTVSVHSKAIEVLRRQPDSGWKLIMGDPNGRR